MREPRRPSVWRAGLTALGASLLVMASARDGRAEQFVLFDATFTYTWDDAVNARPSRSHYYVNEGNWLNKQRPANWVSPVNYRTGKVHIRAEVLEKPPGDQKVGWALCYVANVGSYGCPYTDYYTRTGVYERDVDMRTFYNNNTIQWDRGIKQVDLVYTINDSGSGHISNYPALKDLTTPTRVRITMVQASSGASYDPSILGGPASVPDGGGERGPEPPPELPADAGVTVEAGRDLPAPAVDAERPAPPDPAPEADAGDPAGAGGTDGNANTHSRGCAIAGRASVASGAFGGCLALWLVAMLLRRRRFARARR
jgi:hypothetical protein